MHNNKICVKVRQRNGAKKWSLPGKLWWQTNHMGGRKCVKILWKPPQPVGGMETRRKVENFGGKQTTQVVKWHPLHMGSLRFLHFVVHFD